MSSVWHTIYSFLWSYEPSLDPENSYNDYENIQTDPIELAPTVIVLKDSSTSSNIILKDSSTSESTASNHELMYASKEESNASKLSGGVTAAKFLDEETAYNSVESKDYKLTEEEDDSDDEFIKALPMTTCDLL